MGIARNLTTACKAEDLTLVTNAEEKIITISKNPDVDYTDRTMDENNARISHALLVFLAQ